MKTTTAAATRIVASSLFPLPAPPPPAPAPLRGWSSPLSTRHTIIIPRCLEAGGPGSIRRRTITTSSTGVSGGAPAQSQQQQQQQLQQRRRRHASSSNRNRRPKTALFFPGQGVQKVGMLTPWVEAFPRTAAPILDEIDTVMGYSLTRIIAEGPNSLLSATPHAQPAIMATSILVLRVLEREFGFDVGDRIDFTLGHSLGEFAALVAGGYLAFEDSLYLVKRRAEVMAAATATAREEYGGEYGMVAIVTEPEYLAGLIEAVNNFTVPSSDKSDSGADSEIPPIQQVRIANVNSKNQIVLSGSIERIKTLVAHVRQFLGHDPRAVRLNSDSPFHSPIMKPAVAAMRRLLDGKRRRGGGGGGDSGSGSGDGGRGSRGQEEEEEELVTFPGEVRAISNVTARPFESRAMLKDLVARSCLETVRWWDSIRYLDQQEKVRRWIGIGPGKVGRNLVGKEVGIRGTDAVKGGGVWAITDPSEVEEVLRGLEETDPIVEEEEDERIVGDEP